MITFPATRVFRRENDHGGWLSDHGCNRAVDTYSADTLHGASEALHAHLFTAAATRPLAWKRKCRRVSSSGVSPTTMRMALTFEGPVTPSYDIGKELPESLKAYPMIFAFCFGAFLFLASLVPVPRCDDKTRFVRCVFLFEEHDVFGPL